jgi:hypothetical protein
MLITSGTAHHRAPKAGRPSDDTVSSCHLLLVAMTNVTGTKENHFVGIFASLYLIIDTFH